MSEKLFFNSKLRDSWLSSFEPCVVRVDHTKDGQTFSTVFPSVEHGYHFFKIDTSVLSTEDMELLNSSSMTAAQIKAFTRNKKLTEGWYSNELCLRVMYALDSAKYRQNIGLREKLLATDDLELVEFSPWETKPYWGVDSLGKGPNKKGLIVMRVRKDLRDTRPHIVAKQSLVPHINLDKRIEHDFGK